MLHRARPTPAAADSTSAWYARANALQAQSHLDEAAACYRRTLELDPLHADAQYNLATTLIMLGRDAEAEPLLRAMLAAGPASADVLQNLGIALAAQRRYAEAEHFLRRALAAGTPSVALLKDLALALRHQGHHAEAVTTLERALARAPADAQLRCDIGNLLHEHGAFARARAYFDAALKQAPTHREAAARRGCLDLLDGKIRAGWPGYRLLMRDALVAQNPGLALDTTLPADLSGKTLLLLGEQGIGEELIFLRYVPLLKQRGARAYYRAESRIGAVLQARTTCLERVLTLADALPARDYTLLIGDLPGLVGGDTIPPALALAPLAARSAALRERLAACGPAPYVGVSWRAGIDETPAARLPSALTKQIPLPQFAPVLRAVPGTLLALQRRPEPGELTAFARMLERPLHDFSDAGDDLEDLLALLELLDDYVAVSNTNMHLLAGLGRRARVLMPCPPDWRWMAAGRQSPWFPGFMIYRQHGDGGWSDALQELQRDLDK